MTVTVPHYVTTDGAGRWTGTGARLSAAQFDIDMYTLQAAINGLSLTPGVGVASISQPTAGTLLFTMTDATTQGPFLLPVGQFNFRGVWAASTAYAVNDVFQQNSTLYAVVIAHTSGSTFDAGINDGAGHNYLKVMVTFPSGVLPAGGTTGQALTKVNGTDFNTQWSTLPNGIPASGASGKFVGWLSAGTGQWLTVLQLPASGTAAQTLVKNSSTDGDAVWQDVVLTDGANITISGTWPSLTISSANAPLVVAALSATTGTVSVDFSTCDIATVTPTGDITLNASAPLAKTVSLRVTTSGTTSRTITFGTNFKSSGTLSTGTVTAKSFIVKFDGDGAAFFEFARSAAL
jgi:hypothetical protein